MKFTLLKSWEEVNLEIITDSHPFIQQIYPMVMLSKHRLDAVMARNSIQKRSSQGEACLAFFLGIISGDIRTTINTAQLDNIHLLHLILTAYGYFAIRTGRIKSDQDWVSVMVTVDDILERDEYAWYYRKGLGTAGLWGDEPELNWRDFEIRIRTNPSSVGKVGD